MDIQLQRSWNISTLSPNVTQKYHSTPTFEPPKPYKFNKFFSTISSSHISTPTLLEHQKYPTKHLRTLLTNPPRHKHPKHHHIRATCQTSFPLLSIPVNIAKQEETRNISSPRFIHDNRRRPFRGQILAGHPAMHYLARGRASQRGRKIDRRG